MVVAISEINSVRRYYFSERLRARAERSPTEPAWQAKQEAEPGTPLPATFPMLEILAPVGYTTYADLWGADRNELQTAGLTSRQAEVVMLLLETSGNPDITHT